MMNLTGTAAVRMCVEYLKGRGYSSNTIAQYAAGGRDFFEWLSSKRMKEDAREVTGGDLTAYALYIFSLRKGKSGVYTAGTRRAKIGSLRAIFRFLSRHEYILSNPFDGVDLAMPRLRGERRAMKEKEISAFLDGIKGEDAYALRDRAIFELMYGTGLRVGETAGLDLTDVDLNAGRLVVRNGKGRRDRIVPLGKNAAGYLRNYLTRARGELLKYSEDTHEREALFLNNRGRRIRVLCIQRVMKKRFTGTHPGAGDACPHMLRHSFATHMLDRGAGVKEIKEMLGHRCIASTVHYTHFTAGNLKRIIRMYHPRENELYVEFSAAERRRIRELIREEEESGER
jgi:site-specific recombinase XerD